MKKIIFLFLFVIGMQLYAQEKPNILWIVCEDISPTLSMYGDTTAKTPNLDALAKQSLIFDNAFVPVGVCAPTRSSIITGMYPTSIGTMNMRTGKDVSSWGRRVYNKNIVRTDVEGGSIIEYAAVIPSKVKCFTEYLRQGGYFCTNNAKTDYQFAAPVTAWDKNDENAHWRNRPKQFPFFSVFNIGLTHESQLWKQKQPLTVQPKDVPVPPYLQDTELARMNIARHYSNVELMDAEVGKIISQLKEDGLYDSTIIFFYSDHGGPLPRQKRAILDSGLKVPFMVKSVNSENIGRTNQLISFVDLAPTILSLGNIEPPKHLDGKAFLGTFTNAPRNYVYGSSDRFDESTDRSRAIRNKQFLYVVNYFPEKIKYKEISYRKNIPMMNELLELKEQKKLNETQLQWFQTKTIEELYDCENDPHNLVNIAQDAAYKSILTEFRNENLYRIQNYPDLGLIPEAKLIDMMWPNFEQPVTNAVTLGAVETSQGRIISLSSQTKGASIAYYISKNPNEELNYNSNWKLYSKPLTVEEGNYVYTIAERIGFKESDISIIKIDNL